MKDRIFSPDWTNVASLDGCNRTPKPICRVWSLYPFGIFIQFLISKCDFLITMNYLFRYCISCYTVRQEAGGQSGGGIWKGWCCRLGLIIFACWRRRWGGVFWGHGLEIFDLPFWWVEIYIGFATTLSLGYSFRIASFLLVHAVGIITVFWTCHQCLYHWAGYGRWGGVCRWFHSTPPLPHFLILLLWYQHLCWRWE